MAGYNNPILTAVLGNQQRDMQNKQFEASFGLQLAQFADNQANALKDQTYRQDVFTEQKRATGVVEKNASDAVSLEAKRFKLAKPTRDATLANTKAQTLGYEATARANNATAKDTEVAAEKVVMGKNWDFMNSTLVDDNGNDIPLEGNPQAQQDFGILMNSPGVNKTLEGKNGEKYEFVGVVPAGEGRSVVQIRDPKYPEKVMYMSRDRTAVEGDPLTAMNMMGIAAFRQQISIAVRQAADKDLPKDLRLAAAAFNAIQGYQKDAPITVGPETLQQSQDIAEKVENNDFSPMDSLGANRTYSAPYQKGITPQVAVSDPSAHDLSQYTYDELGSVSDVEWDEALVASEKRLRTMSMPGQGIDQQIQENTKRQESVTDRINSQTGPPNRTLQKQLDTLVKLGQTLSDRKAAGGDTFDAAQKAHNDLLSAKEFADGTKPAPSAKVKAAANIVKNSKLSARQANDPTLAAEVDKAILANPPTPAAVQESLVKPMPMSQGLLFKLRTAQAMGMIDEDAIARVVDTGKLSASGVTVLQQQMMERTKVTNNTQDNQTKIITEAMKNDADANKPKYNTTADGTVQAIDSTSGKVMWQLAPGADTNDGRDQQAKTIVMQRHNDQGDDGIDIYDSVTELSQMGNVDDMPMLEQNLLAQNLNQVLYEELGVNTFNSPIDWFFGSDEDQARLGDKFSSINPMDKVTTRFALADDGTITMYDQYGEPHGDRDYKLTNVGNDAVQLALGRILLSPRQVEENLIPMRLKKMEDELARRQNALGEN